MPCPHVQQHCPPSMASYFVQPGDTLADIARRFGKKVYIIELFNPGLNIYTLRPGQEICLPR